MLFRPNGAVWLGLNRPVHEGMNDVSNVKVHLPTCSGNENISFCIGLHSYFDWSRVGHKKSDTL